MHSPYQSVLLMLAYGLPILYLSDLTLHILRKNACHAENRLAAATTTALGLGLLCQYVIHTGPLAHATNLYAYANYPLIFLVACTGVLFYMKITGFVGKLGWRLCALFAYTPLLVYATLLVGFGSDFLFDPATTDGTFHRDRPTGPFYWAFLLVLLVTSLTGWLCYRAWKRSRLTGERKRFEALLKANVYCLAAIGAAYFAIVATPIPDAFAWMLGAIWAVSLRTYMKYDFLPSVERKFELLYELSPAAIVIVDRNMALKDANPAALRLLGIDDGEDGQSWKDRDILDFIMEEGRAPIRRGFRETFPRRSWDNREMTVVNRRGEEKTLLVDTGLMKRGGEWFVLGVIRDITERKAEERHISYLAHHDPLTGLPNRLLFQRKLEGALEDARKSGTSLAVLLIDLDRFKLINDTLGHAYGDRALIEAARRLQSALGDSEATMLARLGGDEFVLLQRDIRDAAETERLSERLLQAFALPVSLEGRLYYLGGSVGISRYPRDGRESDCLLQNADIAMYHAKQAGGQRRCFFAEAMLEPVRRDVEFVHRLHQALAKHEFVLHYQPQVDVATGAIVGAEALLRWNAEGRGMISPGEFVPIAERAGLIEGIGRWALTEACRQGKLWQDAGVRDFVLSVNVSPKQFLQPDFARIVTQTVLTSGLEPARLCLEITESMVVHNLGAARDMLGELASLGIGIAIDDFGTGYSSLSVIGQLPIDTIKIDRSFVAGTDSGPNGVALVRAIVSMGRDLGKRVVAEGVETDAQHALLSELGCETAQGFRFYKPMPAERLDELVLPTWRQAQ